MAVQKRVPLRVPDDVLEKVAERAFQFCEMACGVELYPFQRELGQRLVRSIILEDSAEITALFARQSGKTETAAVVIAGLMVLLPTLADSVPDERILKYKDGFKVGIFAPSYDTVGILCQRIRDRLYGSAMLDVMSDPEIGMDDVNEKATLSLPNGSSAVAHTTNPRVPLEGHTYQFLVCDETQDIPDVRIRKSIHPMGAATGASILKIGTTKPSRCEFHDACQRNKRADLGVKKVENRQHFEFDYTYREACDPRYAKYMKEEIGRLGFESDDFRLSYRLHWIMERGQFLSPEQVDECGVKRQDTLKVVQTPSQIKRKEPEVCFVRPSNVVTFDAYNRHVASIDIGRKNDSTVVTVGRVWWDNPIAVASRTVYNVHAVNWLELQGDDHESQFPQIVDFLKNYRLDNVLVDATGRGDPVFERLQAELRPFNVPVSAFVFSQQSKHVGYALLQQELMARRLTYPAGPAMAKLSKYRRFLQQFYDLEKTWNGKYMSVQAPKRVRDAHDDFPDGLMLLEMATQVNVAHEVEVEQSPFFESRRGAARMRNARAWWRT